MNVAGLRLRPATEGDHPYIFATWVNHRVRQLPKARRRSEGEHYRRNYVDSAIRQGGHLYVACSDASPNTLHGWICVLDDGGIAAMYVAKDLRGQGIGRALMRQGLRGYPDSIVTHTRWAQMSSRFRHEPLPLEQRDARRAA